MPAGPLPDQLSFRGRIYSFLFRFLGPAQLGDPHEPPPGKLPQAAPCPGCGQPMEHHTYVETPQRKRLRCPV